MPGKTQLGLVGAHHVGGHSGDEAARGQALAFDVAGSVEIGLRGTERAVVALDVAHLELHAACVRPRDQGVRGAQR